MVVIGRPVMAPRRKIPLFRASPYIIYRAFIRYILKTQGSIQKTDWTIDKTLFDYGMRGNRFARQIVFRMVR